MEIDVTKRINPIARVVIIKNNHILLTSATNKNDRFSNNLHFLPGGHVEHTELARDTIIREMKEEIDVQLKITNFLGILECVWDNKGQPYHELNIVFEGIYEGMDVNNPPISKETHINYEWVSLDKLDSIKLLPSSFEKLIPLWLNSNRDNSFMLESEI